LLIFLPSTSKMRAVQPVFHERFAGRAFALRDFVLVMRKFQILAAEMQVKTSRRGPSCSWRNIDVPAGPAFAERTRPENFAVVRHARFPEREIGDGFLFVFVAERVRRRASRRNSISTTGRNAAAAAIFFDGEINRAVAGFVGDAARDELFNERDDFGNVLRWRAV
jgi:hypothetical protein